MPESLEVPMLSVGRARAIAALTQSLPEADALALLVDLASGDPALAVSVLNAANSAASSPMTRIANVRTAIVRIGPVEARYCMLAAATRSTFQLSDAGLDADELWRHVIAVASIAEGASGNDFPGAFTAGLLHDIGRMSMAAQYPDRYQLVVAEAKNGGDVEVAEHQQYGITHAEWGGRLARAWQLPEAVVEAIELHHTASTHGLAQAIDRARGTAARLGIGDGLLPGAPPTPNEALLDLAQAWEHRLAGDEWSWRAIWRCGGVRALAVRAGLDPDGALRAA